MKKLLFAGAVLAAMLACNKSKAAEVDEGSMFHVQVDANSDKFPLSATAFFPAEISIHAGDRIEFAISFSGEPHTVALGTNVNEAVKGVRELPAGRAPTDAEVEALAEVFAKVPDIFPEATVTNPFNQSSAQPCFLASGDPPGGPACKKKTQPQFKGTESFYNSGYLDDGEKFLVKFAKTIKPGSYNFMCMVHRENMIGTVHVVDEAANVQTKEQLKKAANASIAELEDGLAEAVENAQNLTNERATVGVAARGFFNAQATTFAPEEVTIPRDGVVNWIIRGLHTVALNAPQDAVGLVQKDADGTLRINPKARDPAGGAPQPPAPFQEDPQTVNVTWNGQGFFNSGPLQSFPPGLITYRLKFTRPGTYQLQCLVHPDMQGKVKVI